MGKLHQETLNLAIEPKGLAFRVKNPGKTHQDSVFALVRPLVMSWDNMRPPSMFDRLPHSHGIHTNEILHRRKSRTARSAFAGTTALARSARNEGRGQGAAGVPPCDIWIDTRGLLLRTNILYAKRSVNRLSLNITVLLLINLPFSGKI